MNRVRNASRLWIAAALLAASTLRPGAAEAQSDEFGVYGSATIGEALMPALIEAYAENTGIAAIRGPGPYRGAATYRLERGDQVTILHLRRRGSDSAFSGLASRSAQIGMSSIPADARERRFVRDAVGVDLLETSSEHVLALDGLAIISHPSNPVPPLTFEQIAQIFSGEIRDWSELGLPARKFAVHARDRISGDQAAFEAQILRPTNRILRRFAVRHGSSADLVAAVAADPGAIGFAPFAFLKDVRAAAIAMPCGKIAAPTPFAVKAEEYPLQRRLFLYTRGWPENPEAAGLLDFALSDAAQPVIDRTGFVDQSLLRQGAADFSDHLIFAMQSAGSRAEIDATKRFAQVTRDRVRLSSTFRFRTGGERLDAKAVADAGRLARWLEQPANAAVEILLIGFSDSVGGYNNNLRLSQARADAIRRAVLVQVGPDFDPNRVKTEAFATVAPVACNEIESGRASNRRVEAWVNR